VRSAPRWFRLLLRLLPEPFRARHEDGILDLLEERSARPGGLSIPFWTRAASDVVWVAAALRFEALGTGSVLQDLRFARRSLRRDFGTAALAVLIAGIGIGASVSVFSIVHALLVRPLPFAEPDRLVLITNGPPGRFQDLSGVSIQVTHLVDLRTEGTQFEDVAGYHLFDAEGDHLLEGPAGPERLTRLRVTANFFDVLGVEPVAGRLFGPTDVEEGAPPAILLTYDSWRTRFGSDPDVVGRSLPLDGESTRIAGVLPAAFDFTSIFSPGTRVDYVAPFALSARNNRTGNTMALVGRLADGASVESAASEAEALAARGEAGTNDRNDFNPWILPLRDHISGSWKTAVLVLAGAVGLVMLLVCANLSNLLLARGAARQKELAIRTAMGARRGRLVRQMLVESTLLAGLGSLLGLGIAVLCTRWLATLPVGIALLDSVRIDGGALAFALVTAGVTALGFGVAPALRLSDLSLGAMLKESSRNASQSRGHRTLRNGLIVSQMMLACTLVVAASLTSRSLLELMNVELGFEPEETLALRIDPALGFGGEEQRIQYLSSALDRVRSAPGVESAGLADLLPMGFNRMWCVRSYDAVTSESSDCANTYVRVVSEDFTDAMGLTLLAGRDFTARDDGSVPGVVLVSERLASLMWPEEDPISRILLTGFRDFRTEWTVVGIVGGTRFLAPDQAPGPEVFFPIRQSSDHSAVYLYAKGQGAALSSSVGDALIGLDSRLPIQNFIPIRVVVGDTLAPTKLLAGLLSAFAFFALALASLGIYAVIAHSVSERQREIGIRIALGASSLQVQRQVLREAAGYIIAGLTLGLVVATLLSRLLGGLLYGVEPLDVPTYAVAVSVLALVAAAACWLPARRASRLQPSVALGSESAPAM